MPLAEDDGDPRSFDEIGAGDDFFAPIELGGPLQEEALPDHGRLVIQRVGITLEGSTPAIVCGIGVAGSLGGALIAQRPDGLIAGLATIGATIVHTYFYFHSGQRHLRRRRRAVKRRTRSQ
jgi:hypothetical protein